MHIGKSADFEQDRSYDDMEGNVKNFVVRDYSRKTKVAMPVEKVDLVTFFKEYRQELVDRILATDAKHAIPEFEKYAMMIPYGYEWDTFMIADEGIHIDELRRICVLCERKQEAENT